MNGPEELLFKDSEDHVRECVRQLERWPHLRWRALHRARWIKLRVDALVAEPTWVLIWWSKCVRSHAELPRESHEIKLSALHKHYAARQSGTCSGLAFMLVASLLEFLLMVLLLRWQIAPFGDGDLRDSADVYWCPWHPDRHTVQGVVLNRFADVILYVFAVSTVFAKSNDWIAISLIASLRWRHAANTCLCVCALLDGLSRAVFVYSLFNVFIESPSLFDVLLNSLALNFITELDNIMTLFCPVETVDAVASLTVLCKGVTLDDAALYRASPRCRWCPGGLHHAAPAWRWAFFAVQNTVDLVAVGGGVFFALHLCFCFLKGTSPNIG